MNGFSKWQSHRFTAGLLALCTVGCIFCASSTPLFAAPKRTWDAQKDFSATHNPNGPWMYGYAETILDDFKRATTHITTNSIDAWIAQPSMEGVEHNGTTYPITVGDDTLEPGGLSLHAGRNGELAILRFVVPSDGKYSFHVTFQTDDLNADTKCRVVADYIVIQSVDWNPKNYTDSTPDIDFSTNNEKFYKGETIDFEVGGQYAYGNDIRLSVNVTRKSE